MRSIRCALGRHAWEEVGLAAHGRGVLERCARCRRSRTRPLHFAEVEARAEEAERRRRQEVEARIRHKKVLLTEKEVEAHFDRELAKICESGADEDEDLGPADDLDGPTPSPPKPAGRTWIPGETYGAPCARCIRGGFSSAARYCGECGRPITWGHRD
jgi:hypothetical protein